MSVVKWNAMTYSDAQQFNNVPAKASTSYERVIDNNPNAPRDWRDGEYVQRENIPSMIIGQEGFGRMTTKHIPRHKIKTVLDILIKREERRIERNTGHVRTVALYEVTPNRFPCDSPARKGSVRFLPNSKALLQQY